MVGHPVTVLTPWGGAVTLSPFASVGATERALHAVRVLNLDSRWPDGARFDYAKDRHFERYTLAAINSDAAAAAFLDALDTAARRRGHGECVKARVMRSWLAAGWCHWMPDYATRVRACAASNRRVCCGCHETGSFATYSRGRRERVA